MLDKLTYDKLNDTYIVDKISHYTIPCNMHRNQTCWVRYPLWEAIADCRCNLTYHDYSRINNGKAHHPTTMPENLPDTEGWVDKVEYEERKFYTGVGIHQWIVATITFHLARPFVNTSGRQYYLGNRNGTWRFYDSNDNLIGRKYKIFNNIPETILKYPIPIPDNCYKIQCNVSSHESQFGSYQQNSNRTDSQNAKFSTVKNIVSRLPLLVNTYKTLYNGKISENAIYEFPGENISVGKFFVQNTKSGQGMTEIGIIGLPNNYFVRNKFSMGDLWANHKTSPLATKTRYARIARFKPHPKFHTEPLIEVLWKSDVFLRMMHPKNNNNIKIGMIRPDAIEYSLFDMFGHIPVNGKGAFNGVSSNDMRMLTHILNGRNIHFAGRPDIYSNNSFEAERFSTNYRISQFGMGSGFVRGNIIQGKGATYNSEIHLERPQRVKFYVFTFIFPHKRHKRTWYRNALHCKWRLFEAPIAKAKFKISFMNTTDNTNKANAYVMACNTVM